MANVLQNTATGYRHLGCGKSVVFFTDATGKEAVLWRGWTSKLWPYLDSLEKQGRLDPEMLPALDRDPNSPWYASWVAAVRIENYGQN